MRVKLLVRIDLFNFCPHNLITVYIRLIVQRQYLDNFSSSNLLRNSLQIVMKIKWRGIYGIYTAWSRSEGNRQEREEDYSRAGPSVHARSAARLWRRVESNLSRLSVGM